MEHPWLAMWKWVKKLGWRGAVLSALTCQAAGILAACQPPLNQSIQPEIAALEAAAEAEPDAVEVSASVQGNDSETTATETPVDNGAFDQGIDLASSAFILGQSAQSSDDWGLVVSRWDRAIAKLRAVPDLSPNYATAQAKIPEYQRNLDHARARLEHLNNPPVPVLVQPAVPAKTPLPVATQPPSQRSQVATASGVYRAPIISRSGGTPVIEVTFNGSHRFPMILDTGASHTHISRRMANQLGIVSFDQIEAATASSGSVVFDVGRVNSISVAGINRTSMVVSIGDAVEVGLLGNDFYRDYDIIISNASVEFRPR